MKKRYIIITPNIYEVGGAQIYIRNKADYLMKKGWEVLVLSSRNNGIIMIDELKQYEKYVFQELNIKPYLFAKREEQEAIYNILTILGNDDFNEIVIESHTINLALWGEIVAEKCEGKHIVYLLSESFGKQPEHILNFLDFKHKRRELAGISVNSFELLFKGWKTFEEDEKYSLKAACGNAVNDVKNPLIDKIIKTDVNLASIGRLDKGYVHSMVNEIIKFANSNPNKHIQLILVGDSQDGSVEDKILKDTENVNNLNIVITGRLFPIPENLFEKAEIFIGLAGSARTSVSYGVPTIVLDTRYHQAIGVLGFDTDQSLFGDECYPLSDKIAEVVNNYDYYKDVNNIKYSVALVDYLIEYENHMDFIIKSANSQHYYFIDYKQTNIEEKILKVSLNILGQGLFLKLIQNKKLLELRQEVKGRSNE